MANAKGILTIQGFKLKKLASPIEPKIACDMLPATEVTFFNTTILPINPITKLIIKIDIIVSLNINTLSIFTKYFILNYKFLHLLSLYISYNLYHYLTFVFDN